MSSHRRPTPRRTRYTLAGLAFAALVGTGIAVAPAAFAAETPVVGLGPSTQTINWGRTVYLSGRVTHRNGYKISTLYVELQVFKNGYWRLDQRKRLDSNGNVVFAVRPDRSRAYRLRFPPWGPYTPSYSRVVGVTVIGMGQAVVNEAAKEYGDPYRFGAAGPYAFDCSGLTLYVMRKFGYSLPHSATAQLRYGTPISKSAMRPGDLVFFMSGSTATHVGIYAGGGYMIDAPTAGQTVGRHRIWSSNIVARRLVS